MEEKKKKKTELRVIHGEKGQNPDKFLLVKKSSNSNKPITREFKTPSVKPTNVEGHYPRFLLPGALNLIEEDRRELSIILESFLPQLDRIGITFNEINNLIREIIVSTETFRRLKGISQIELLPFAFKQVPWYTRYTHSCLTYAFADHVLDKLNSSLNLKDVELEAAKLCFLIHDVGHGPFSHLTERAFKKPRGRHGQIPREYDHEIWTMILLNELQEELFDTNINPYLPKGTDILPHGKLKKSKEYNLEIFNKALSMITKRHHPVVSQLLSSQIDIDRLANYLGDRIVVDAVIEEDEIKSEKMVQYLSPVNEVVDNIKRIINNLVILDKDSDGNNCKQYLAIHEDAIIPVIRYLLDRHIIRYYLLKHYRREEANNILEKILIRAQQLVRNKDLDALGKTDLLVITWLYGNHTEAEFIELDDQLVFNQIRKWAKHAEDPILRDLTLRFTAHSFFNTYACEKNGKPSMPTQEFLDSTKERVKNSLQVDVPNDLISEYYFTYDETTSRPYHTDKDEVFILTSNKKIQKLSEYINETDNEYGKILLNSQFERYLVIVPPEVEL